MDPITLRLSRETIDDVDTEADGRDLRRAEYLRRIVENRGEHERVRSEYEAKLMELESAKDAEIERLRDEYADTIEELERENERLHRERRQLLEQREEHTDLVRYAETQRDLDTRREQRRQANVLRRAWWFVAGSPAD